MEFKIGDICRVNLDWTDVAKGKRGRIISFQRNNGDVYARLLWLGKDAGLLQKEAGVLFNTKDELVKIK